MRNRDDRELEAFKVLQSMSQDGSVHLSGDASGWSCVVTGKGTGEMVDIGYGDTAECVETLAQANGETALDAIYDCALDLEERGLGRKRCIKCKQYRFAENMTFNLCDECKAPTTSEVLTREGFEQCRRCLSWYEPQHMEWGLCGGCVLDTGEPVNLR